MIYRLRYCNKDGVEARVDIQRGSSTPVIEVEGTGNPFTLSYNNDKGNKSGMFLSSSADIEIYETTDFNIDNLKTSNETELSVTHYIDNVVSWQGFIIPDFFSIEVRSNPVITMTASDRLGTLKNVTLSDLPSMISLRELAILCLNKTGLTLPLRTMADFNNGTGVNDFFNSKILTQRLSDTKGRSISCYDILSSILTASYSFLVQRSGAWHIINKIQHEAGSGKLYTDTTSFINWSDVIFNFSDISIGGRRTIIPVASTVGVFHEFGGGKLHPDNYDFAQGTAGWVASGGYSMAIEDREIKGYSKSGSNWIADFGQTTTKKRLKVQNLLNFPLTNLDSVPYAEATFPLITTNTSSVDISMDMSVVGMPWYRTGVVVLAEKGTTLLAFSQSSGKFEPYDPRLATNPGYPDFMINLSLPVQGSAEDKSYYDASTKSMKFSGKLEDSDLTGWNITIRLYGYYSLPLGSRVDFPMFFSFANVSFSNTNEIPKGNIYKTEKDGDFTKAHDIDTSIFADYITYGLNGFFYEYPIDDTSSLYNSANELTSKWTAYNDPEQLPLLQHITRQRSRLFSVAHDLLSAEIEINDFDPLAIFVACNKRHTVVSAQFDFFKSNLSVELEEIDFQSASARDFIYSYFGDGEEGIRSIGGISGGGGGGTSGGLTPEQLEILSWWKKDPDRENTIFTEMNAYSTKELSAYGIGDGGGGGGGSDYERLDTWASYDSSRAGWVLSAFLGNDLNTRVTNLENSGGSGSVTSVGISVPTGLSVSNSPITSSGVIAISLQTGYSIPTTTKQGQWDTAYSNSHTHSNKTVLDDITSALIDNWNTAYTHSQSEHQTIIDGTGFVKANGKTLSYDNNSYSLSNHNHSGVYEPVLGNPSASGYLLSSTNAGARSWVAPYSLPTASATVLGGVKIGTNITISSGVISVHNPVTIGTANGLSLSTQALSLSLATTSANGAFSSVDKTYLELLKTFFEYDSANNAIKALKSLYSTGEVSAYGIGSGGGSGGGIIETVYGYGNLGQTFNNSILTDTFNAYTINQINTRLVSVESGSALTVNTTGTGNAITSISKAGSVITANKDLTFLETSIFNTHNTDNIRHITGAERTKWDTVVTDFDNLEIGGTNLIPKSRGAELGNYDNGGLYAMGGYSLSIDGGDSFRIVSPGVPDPPDNGNNIRIATGKTLQLNETYTLSFEAMTSSSQDRDHNVRMPYLGDNIVSIKTGDWQKYSVTFKITNEATVIDSSNYFFFWQQNQGIYITFLRRVKLEKGTKTTDWSPAPEDQVSDWNETDVNSFSFIKNKPTSLSQFTDNIGVATHIANTSNPHNVTKAQVGLGNVDNTADSAKNVLSATKLQTPRTIWGQSFDGTGNVTGALSGVGNITSTIGSFYLSDSLVNPYLRLTNSGGNFYVQAPSNTRLQIGTTTSNALQIHDNGSIGVGTGSASLAYKLDVNGTGRFTGALTAAVSVTTPKVIFNAAGWSMEQVGSELQMRHNNILKMRFTSAGSIVATEEITAFG